MYEIHSKSDFQSGATLIVRIPEEEVDRKALYTILNDRPDFILPFHHKTIDGQIEFTYQVGNRSKLAYLSGDRSPKEYSDLWFGILQPLLDCWDWFMNPYSFVLKSEYLYFDKNGKSASFVYIPSVQACSDYCSLKSMVTEVAKQNHVTDVSLENQAVWAIQDFNTTEFLKMLKPYRAPAAQSIPPQQMPAPEPAPLQHKAQSEKPVQPAQLAQPAQQISRHEQLAQPAQQIARPEQLVQPAQQMAQPEQPLQPVQMHPQPQQVPLGQPMDFQSNEALKKQAEMPKMHGEISINFPSGGKQPKEKKEKKEKSSWLDSKKEKPAKPPKAPKEKKSSMWMKKQQQEIIQGAAAMAHPYPANEHLPHPNVFPQLDDDSGITQLEFVESDAPKLRYVGNDEHPRVIEVAVDASGIFTIGRFDVSIGTKQSSFEFHEKTKAVSRRHAVIERKMDGYFIVDFGSSAGTFLNGQRMPPNAPFKLERGCRVSFGYSGADYVWEGEVL